MYARGTSESKGIDLRSLHPGEGLGGLENPPEIKVTRSSDGSVLMFESALGNSDLPRWFYLAAKVVLSRLGVFGVF